MPGMDGPTTFRELQKNPVTAKIPVLFLTAKVQATDRARFAGLGIQAVLVKPFDPLTLSVQIANVLGWEWAKLASWTTLNSGVVAGCESTPALPQTDEPYSTDRCSVATVL